MKWFKLSPKPWMTESLVQKSVHVAYSPITSMNYQWTINLHDGYPRLNVLIPVEYIPPSIPTLCNPKYTMFHFGVISHSFINEPQHDSTSLASPNKKGRWKILSVGIGFSKVQDQALCILVSLHLQSSIKNQHLQRSIKSRCCVKLSLTSQSLHHLVYLTAYWCSTPRFCLPLQLSDHSTFNY